MSGKAAVQLPNDREPGKWISEKEWMIYIEKGPDVRYRLSSAVSIFRVPNLLKDAKKEAYVPRRVSLGPHHHGSAELPQMGHHKGRALRRLKKRFNAKTDFAYSAKKEILNMDKEIRDSYEENIDCDEDTLARMLTLDGCFILEVLTTLYFKEFEEKEFYEPIFGEEKLQYAASDILKDILKLENQVPFTVLQKLLELVLVENRPDIEVENRLYIVRNKLWNVLISFISGFQPFNIQTYEHDFHIHLVGFLHPRLGEQHVHHLLGFLHAVIVSPPFNEVERVDEGDTAIVSPPFNRGEFVDQDEGSIFIKCCCMCTGMHGNVDVSPPFNEGECVDKNKARDDIESIPCAVELRNAGIKFERCGGGIKEIKFDPNSATISLPPICIKDNTEIVFRNLIAFEICKSFKINYVACYVKLMNDLIDSKEDVALLRRMGVLTSFLGSDIEVADLFNGLCKDVIFSFSSEDAFNKLRKDVNSVISNYKNKMKVQFAELERDHFSSPWKALALAAAIVILLLTVVQTIFSIISVYKGK